MKYFIRKFIWASFLISATIHAQECTHLWNAMMEIDSPNPKAVSGDTFAGYGLIGWYDVPGMKLIMTGEFPRGRFMSFESYTGEKKWQYDAKFDFDMVADTGSENPFVDGGKLETSSRSYSIDVAKLTDGSTTHTNLLKLDPKGKIHSVFYRAYVPSEGVSFSEKDLPRIFAVNAATNEPMACPKTLDTAFKPGFIKLVLAAVPAKKKLVFKERSIPFGANHAIPNYVMSFSRVAPGDVTVLKFKAPTFTDTTSGKGSFHDTGEVRYWSMCTQNMMVSETLKCLPDYQAKVDGRGFVTVVVGRGSEVKALAERRGWNFIDDNREEDQPVVGYLYRNLLPKEGFPRYRGDYLPVGRVCSESEFVSGGCAL